MPSNDPEYQKKYIREHYKRNKEYYKDKAKHRKELMTKERRLFESVRYRARAKGIPFDLEESDIIIPKECPILRKTFEKYGEYSPSVDKLVPSLGYTKGNIFVISKRANRIKNNATPEEIALLNTWMQEKAVALSS